MKKLVIFFIVSGAVLYAQEGEVGAPTANDLQSSVESVHITEVSVEKFELDGTWSAFISADAGFATSRLFDGGPSAKVAIEGEAESGLDLPDSKVLGVRVDFLRRGAASLIVRPQHPIPIEGVTKTVSVWVAGRNYEHKAVLLIQDYYGRNFELELGKLNYQGWKQLKAAIPPQDGFGHNGIVQRNLHYAGLGGLRITGLRVDCDPLDAYGTYYVYFDDMRAEVDLYGENSREPDDPSDAW